MPSYQAYTCASCVECHHLLVVSQLSRVMLSCFHLLLVVPVLALPPRDPLPPLPPLPAGVPGVPGIDFPPKLDRAAVLAIVFGGI